MNKEKITSALSILNDLHTVYHFLAWQTEQGDQLAQEIVNEIQEGKYGDDAGFFVQTSNALTYLADVHEIDLREVVQEYECKQSQKEKK